MQYIIPILILFILLNSVLKLSFWRWWQVGLFSALVAGFVLFASTFAAEQSKTELQAWLQNTAILQNVAALVTVEVVIVFGFAFVQLRQVLVKPQKSHLILPLKAYPGLLLLPVLFFLLAQLFFSLSGVSFDAIAYTLAIGIFVALPLSAYGLAKLVPEEELRLELLFITNLFVCIIGLITTVNGETAYLAVEQPINPKALLLASSGFLLLFVAGFFYNKFRKIKL